MDLYFERHDGEAATVEDFIACFADANKRDLSQFMLWYSQSGTPELVCKLSWNARTKTAELTVEQVQPPTPGQPKKKPQHIPLKLGLLGANGQEITLERADGVPVKDGLVEVTEQKQVIRFTGVPSRPVASLNRGFSAPINLTLEQTERDLEFLMVHDSDLYNRWHAVQTLATRTIIEMVDGIRSGKRVRRGAKLAKALALSLADDSLEPAYRAQLMTLPSESDIAREIRRDVDPAAIHEAKSSLCQDHRQDHPRRTRRGLRALRHQGRLPAGCRERRQAEPQERRAGAALGDGRSGRYRSASPATTSAPPT